VLDNPTPQANAQARALKSWLLRHGLAAEPRPVICLSHPELAIDNADASSVPVLVCDPLPGHLQVGRCLRSRPVLPARWRGCIRTAAWEGATRRDADCQGYEL